MIMYYLADAQARAEAHPDKFKIPTANIREYLRWAYCGGKAMGCVHCLKVEV